MKKFKYWFSQSLHNQIFSLIMLFSILLSIAVGSMGLGAMELTADRFLSERLKVRLNQLISQSKQQQAVVKVWQPPFFSYGPTDTKPVRFADIDTPGIYEFLNPDFHLAVTKNPIGDGLIYLKYDTRKDDIVNTQGDNIRIVVFLTSLSIILMGLIAARILASVLSSPLHRLAKDIAKLEPGEPLIFPPRNDEIGKLATEFTSALARNAEFSVREQNFTRYVSHELRTPVSVIRGATEIMEKHPAFQGSIPPPLNRINEANQETEQLITTFLHLGREDCLSNNPDLSNVYNELKLKMKQHSLLLDQRDIEIVERLTVEKYVQAPRPMLQVLLNNLVKNAFSYCHSQVSIEVNGSKLTIKNDLPETAKTSGFGHGIEISQRICSSCGWITGSKVINNRYITVVYFG